MTGYRVDRKGGWDCHGLPVELAAEKQLGLHNKHEIETYGIERFNAVCRASVFSNIDDWTRLTERIGFWIDTDDAYRTLDPSYIESVWWALQQIHAKGLLFEKLKVVPYCPRCGTALSSHELGQPGAYQDDVDLSAYVILPSARGNLVVWTTTPVDAGLQRRGGRRPRSHLRAGQPARGLQHSRRASTSSPRRWSRRCSVRARSSPSASPAQTSSAWPTSRRSHFITAADYGAKGHTVLAGDFVTAEDGTGLVHTAIAFGEDDFQPRHRRAWSRSTRSAPTAPMTRASPPMPAARSRTATRTWSRTCAPAGGCSRPCPTSTPIPTAGAVTPRCSTTPSRPGTSPPPRSRTGCWRRMRRSTGSRRTSSTAASASGWRATSTGRCHASATGARRCRSGAVPTGTSR